MVLIARAGNPSPDNRAWTKSKFKLNLFARPRASRGSPRRARAVRPRGLGGTLVRQWAMLGCWLNGVGGMLVGPN
eukprot:11159640-Lingulodinium_polyedra.AAC.1